MKCSTMINQNVMWQSNRIRNNEVSGKKRETIIGLGYYGKYVN